MISRAAAKSIGDAYNLCYVHTSYSGVYPTSHLYRDQLYELLYVNNFDAWICNAVKMIVSDSRGLLEYVMKLHTGESIASGTPQWTWAQRQALGQRLLKEFAESLIRERITNPEFETHGESKKRSVDAMRSMLELDGFIYRDGILYVPEESVIQEPEEQGLLVAMMGELALQDIPTLRHHLDLSASHYQEGLWDDSISNSRKVLEGILQQTALRASSIHATNAPIDYSRPADVRNFLEASGILEKKEKETLSQVYGLLSETGGHPYVAQKDQARLMRHLSLTFCQFVLLRLRGALSKPNIT